MANTRSMDPMIPALLLAVVMIAVTVAFTGGVGEGEWRAKLHRSDGRVELKIRPQEGLGQWRLDLHLKLDELQGLQEEDFSRSGEPVRFEWVREAGTLIFDGTGGRRPSGDFSFEPNPAFVESWDGFGFVELEPDELFHLAVEEFPLSFAAGLHEAGYRGLRADDVMRLRNHGIEPEYVEAMRGLGYLPRIDEVVRLRTHGVRPVVVEELAELRLEGIPVEDLIRFRTHGIRPVFLREMADAGHGPDDVHGVIRLRTHGIEPGYVAALNAAGERLDIEDVIRLRTHGVSPEYYRGMVDSGLPEVSVARVVRLRTHGASPEFVRDIVAAGYEHLGVEGLIKLITHGVSATTVEELVELGYDDLSAGELARLRSHGVSPSFVRELAEEGYTGLTVEELIRARSRGKQDWLRRRRQN